MDHRQRTATRVPTTSSGEFSGLGTHRAGESLATGRHFAKARAWETVVRARAAGLSLEDIAALDPGVGFLPAYRFTALLPIARQAAQMVQNFGCTIRIPEVVFEALYPGQYRRLIKGVRVSIPAVVGPYTNVSAKLALLKGEVEVKVKDGDALTERPVAKNTSSSLSGALNDSGTFEFSHRDGRFLPFEGAGAISERRLELPSAIRSFDHDTISDVLVHS